MQEKELQYHIKCKKGDVGGYAILPGDPGRVPEIAKYLENAKQVAYNREFNVYTGYLCGEKVSICSTGIGGPSAAIAMEELTNIGVHTFIRVGTCGGIDLNVKAGDLVVANGAIRFEHTSCEYAPLEFPAVPDMTLTLALYLAAEDFNYNTHVGVVQCKDSFYGQHRPDLMPSQNELLDKWSAWKRLNVKASEMESAALFVVSSVLKTRCGAVFNVIWNQERENAGLDQEVDTDTTKSIKVGIKALEYIINSDNNPEIEDYIRDAVYRQSNPQKK